MQKKVLLIIAAVQTAVILSLLALIWNHGRSAPEPILPDSVLALIGLVSIAGLFLSWKQTRTLLSLHEPTTDRHQGLVKWFNPTKGFGFIEQENGQDLFVHQSEIRQGGFRYLMKDDRVEYQIGTGKKGPVAQNVVRIQAALSESDQMVEDQRVTEVP